MSYTCYTTTWTYSLMSVINCYAYVNHSGVAEPNTERSDVYVTFDFEESKPVKYVNL